jgi:5-methylthioadenosine/S-adenosylhomocysteine deaminase
VKGTAVERFVADVLLAMSSERIVPIHRGAVDVEDGKVVWSGPLEEATSHSGAVIEIRGILMPGFVDTHCHTPMVLLRGAGEGLLVNQWLKEVMWPREARLEPDDVALAMKLGGSELLRGGITTSVEMYFHGQAVAEAADEIGLRCVVTPPVIEDAQLSSFGTPVDQIQEMVALSERWRGSDLVEVGVGPHATYSVSDEVLRTMSAVASEQGMLIHIHVAEQEWEDGAVRERTGMSAPAYLESIGMFENRVLAAHSVWMDDEDVDIFARNGVAVAHCPCSNMKHASGIARVEDLLGAGIRVGLGTDGPASHHRLDFFEEMRTAMRVARIRTRDAQQLPPNQVLWMATAGAADAIGRPDLGRLAPGSKADMIAIDTGGTLFHPVIRSEDDPVSRLVFQGSPTDVTDVWVSGRKVVENRAVTTFDVESAIEELDARAEGLLS